MVLTDAGSLVLHREPTDVGALAADAVEAFKTQAETAGVKLGTDLGDNLPSVEVDPARIRGVLGNLLSNAIRHTPSGGSVKVTASGTVDAVTVIVADTGEGIPPDLLPHVFERFVKGASSTGTGLGLAIAHDIVTAHGGRLDITSKEGSGTQATLSLPVRPAASN
jgi:two-component system sensor histidine kinase BaeS